MSVKAVFDFGYFSLTSITAYYTTSGFSRCDTDGGAAAKFRVHGVPHGYGRSVGQMRDLDQWTPDVRLAHAAVNRL